MLRELLAAEGSVGAVVLTGEPGIGKTALWETGVSEARERRWRALSARPSDAESRLSFSALADLFEGIGRTQLKGVPAPQLHALEVALLRAEPTGPPSDPHAIAMGLLNAIRALGAGGPVLIAIDDVQWLDRASADALVFASRRLEPGAAAFLLTRRSGRASGLERALDAKGMRRHEVGPLSLGATRRVIFERLGLSLPRRVMRRVHDSAQGNPLFALEVARLLGERGLPQIGEDMPVPDMVDEVLGARVGRLAGPVRRLLVAVTLSADLRTSQLGAISDPAVIEQAVEAGVLLVEGDRVRAAHPLLAAAAKRGASAAARRALHLDLAQVVSDEQLRVRHLALATREPDGELASTVGTAAATAHARGAAEAAVELAEHALRLTPPASAGRCERLLALAEYLLIAGDYERVTELLSPELDGLPSGAARARAHLLLLEGGASSAEELNAHLERALVESKGDAGLRSHVLALKAEYAAVAAVERVADAEAWALEAMPAARRSGPEAERLVLNGLAWARILRGRPVDDLRERFHAVSGAAFHIADSPDRAAAVRHCWRGELDDARAIQDRLLALADQRGEALSYVVVRMHLCELELRAGEWDAAAGLLDDWSESADRGLLAAPHYERCRALLAAGRGLPDETERWAAQAVAQAQATGVRWDALEASRARGTVALLAGEPARAAASLRPVWDHLEREGVEDPGAFPVAPELVEALAELGAREEAQGVAARLEELARGQRHAWGAATTMRCDALVSLGATAQDDEAAEKLAQAAAAYDRIGLRFDRARCLLALGRAQRRGRKWGTARDSLEQAAAAFAAIGAPGWVKLTHSELARVGGRRAAPAGGLTAAERRVAELAADGLSNKEIAGSLFVTVGTVEGHLTRAYAKLGVRSRAQLARRLRP